MAADAGSVATVRALQAMTVAARNLRKGRAAGIEVSPCESGSCGDVSIDPSPRPAIPNIRQPRSPRECGIMRTMTPFDTRPFGAAPAWGTIRRPAFATAAGLLALAVLVAGACGGDDADESPTTTTTTATSPVGPPPAPPDPGEVPPP